jgi:hypothetical protein
MNKYEKFVIYKIYQKSNPDIVYIGSSINFSKRKSSHKKYCSNKSSKKYKCVLYSYIRACGGWDKFDMEIIEKYPCKSLIDGLLKEKEMIEKYNAKLNTNTPIKELLFKKFEID